MDGVALVLFYMPVSGSEVAAIEGAKEEVMAAMEWVGSEEIMVAGSDVNAHVGSGSQRPGVCGRFGLQTSNVAGQEFIEWLGENDLSLVNSLV